MYAHTQAHEAMSIVAAEMTALRNECARYEAFSY